MHPHSQDEQAEQIENRYPHARGSVGRIRHCNLTSLYTSARYVVSVICVAHFELSGRLRNHKREDECHESTSEGRESEMVRFIWDVLAYPWYLGYSIRLQYWKIIYTSP